VADGEDPAIDAVKPSTRHAPSDRAATDPDGGQLAMSDQAMLPASQLGDPHIRVWQHLMLVCGIERCHTLRVAALELPPG